MNAGSSERGRHFACRHCDLVFTNIRSHDIATNTAHVAAYHKLARETYGREVKVWGSATVIQAEKEKEARDFYHYYVHEGRLGRRPRCDRPWRPRSTSAAIRKSKGTRWPR